VTACHAARHRTGYAAQRHGCTCPDALAARRAQRGTPVPGRGKRGRSERELVAERVATTRRLTRAGWSAGQIAEHLGIAQRTVVRYRAELRQLQAA
jgi:DNA-binding NarL/FixJ family response regulator